MRALLINAVCGIRSTGRICTDLAKELEVLGYEVKIAYGRESVPDEYKKYGVRIGNEIDVYWHAFMARYFDQPGLWSKKATRDFLVWADKFDPDLLWLHNIHDYYINYELLFEWIKSRPQMQVKWTQHDCWAFTGGCMHFIIKNCYQWKTQCISCPKGRSRKIIRTEKENYIKKRNAFTGVPQMTIVAVSDWSKRLIEESFLNEYPVEVCYNKVDRTVFKPTASDFKERYGLTDKKIVLGLSNVWNAAKGFYHFIELSEMLDGSYAIVMVGLNEKQRKMLPESIIALSRISSVHELAEIYTAADVFVNPSREETFGMTTLEALCCGTSAVVFKDTACEEVANMYGGVAVDQSVNAVYDAIEKICKGNSDK